jgi:hypothetical protein
MYSGFDKNRCVSMEQVITDIGRQKIKSWLVDFQCFGDFKKHGHWYNAKRCWKAGLEVDSTHHLLLQDDIRVCNNFIAGVLALIEAVPDQILNLFFGHRKDFDGTSRWGSAESVWGQAIVMPKNILSEFLEWEAANIKPEFIHDDSRVSLFMAATNRRAMVPFPNLVDHRDTEMKSVLGHPRGVRRTSIDYMGTRNPLDFDWNDKEKIMFSGTKCYEYAKEALR